MYLIYELLWYLLAACLEDIVTLEEDRVKYLFYTLDQMISTYRVHVMLQYLVI